MGARKLVIVEKMISELPDSALEIELSNLRDMFKLCDLSGGGKKEIRRLGERNGKEKI